MCLYGAYFGLIFFLIKISLKTKKNNNFKRAYNVPMDFKHENIKKGRINRPKLLFLLVPLG